MTACAREAVDAGGARPSAIGLSGQMHGLVMAWPMAGPPPGPALGRQPGHWTFRAYRRLGPRGWPGWPTRWPPDDRADAQVDRRERTAHLYRGTRWALAPKDWIRARLTGEFHAEPSDASATLLYDLIGDRWDLEVVGALGLDASLLAPLLPSQARGPATYAEAAAELGLPAGLPVAAGAGDTAAAALGSGIGPGDIQLTVGTGAQVIRPLIAPVSRADAGINLYRSATPDGWYHMGATISAGLSLNWVREIMNATWEELYASADQPAARPRPDLRPASVGGTDTVLRSGAARLLDRVVAGRRPGVAVAVRARGNRVRHPRRARCPARPTIARRVCGWRAGAPWPPAGDSCSRMCWGCRCTRWTFRRRLAGARLSSELSPPACSASTTSRDRWPLRPAWWPNRTRR